MSKLFDLSTGAMPGIAPMRPIKPINQTAGVTWNGARKAGYTKKLGLVLLGAAFTLCQVATAQPQSPVYLGSAAPFAVLAKTGVTNVGNTVITGDLGVWPIAGTAVTGFSGENAGGPGKVIGTIQDNDTAGETLAAQHGQASLAIAIGDAKGRTGAFKYVNYNLGGSTLTPGLYRNSGILTISGNLYLNGAGVYIFQIATGLTATVNTHVFLENGAVASNVFWQVGTQATLGSDVVFEGNILAGTAITMTDGTTLNGRALAQTNVTLIHDVVTVPTTRRQGN